MMRTGEGEVGTVIAMSQPPAPAEEQADAERESQHKYRLLSHIDRSYL